MALVGSHEQVYLRGLELSLAEFGHQVEVPRRLEEWLPSAQSAVLVAGPCLDDVEGAVAACLPRTHRLPLVALLSEPRHADYLRAVRAGADAALPTDTQPERIAAAIHAVGHGVAVLPAEVLREMAARVPAEAPPALTGEQLAMLQGLVDGVPVESIAQRLGYSPRTMYRLLSELYDDMGVQDRTQAIVKTAELQVLDSAAAPQRR